MIRGMVNISVHEEDISMIMMVLATVRRTNTEECYARIGWVLVGGLIYEPSMNTMSIELYIVSRLCTD